MNARARQIAWVLGALIVVLALDQWTKALIIAHIPINSVTFEGREQTFFFLTHDRNTGLVGGAFSDAPLIARAAPLLAGCVLLFLFKFLRPESRLQAIAYGLIAGGAIGNNLIDRLFRGSVVDFLQFNFYFIPFDFPWKRYPAFNIADSGICVGVFLLMASWYWLERRPHVSNAA